MSELAEIECPAPIGDSYVKTLAEFMPPLRAVRRAERLARQAEAAFQLRLLESLDLSREPPEQRELVRSWLRQLRAIAG
jgi:hypothetical protein